MSERGCRNRRFTPDEDERLVALRLQYPGCEPGKSGAHCRSRAQIQGLRTIAGILGRAKSSVQVRLNMLAEREEQ